MGREERLSENLRSDDPSITLPWFYSTDTTNGGYCYYDKVTGLFLQISKTLGSRETNRKELAILITLESDRPSQIWLRGIENTARVKKEGQVMGFACFRQDEQSRNI